MNHSENNSSLEEIKNAILKMLSKKDSKSRDPENPLASPLDLIDVVEPLGNIGNSKGIDTKISSFPLNPSSTISNSERSIEEKPISMTSPISTNYDDVDDGVIKHHLHDSINKLQKNNTESDNNLKPFEDNTASLDNQLAKNILVSDKLANYEEEPLILNDTTSRKDKPSFSNSSIGENNISDNSLLSSVNKNLEQQLNLNEKFFLSKSEEASVSDPVSYSELALSMKQKSDIANEQSSISSMLEIDNLYQNDSIQESSSSINSTADLKNKSEALESRNIKNDGDPFANDASNKLHVKSPDIANEQEIYMPVKNAGSLSTERDTGLKNFNPSESASVIPKIAVEAAIDSLNVIENNKNTDRNPLHNKYSTIKDTSIKKSSVNSGVLAKQLTENIAQSDVISSNKSDLDSFIREILKESIKSWVADKMPILVKEMGFKKK